VNFKIIFLSIIIFFSCDFLTLHFMKRFISFDLVNSIISIFFVFYAFFNIKSWKYKKFPNTLYFIITFLLAFLVSSITAYLDWGQNFSDTLIASRSVFWIFFGLFLIKYKTTKLELYKAFEYFSWVYVLLSIFINILPEYKHLFIYYENSKGQLKEDGFLSGIQYTLIPLYFIYSSFLKNEKITLRNYFLMIFIIISIFLTYNRATTYTMIILISVSYLYNKKINLAAKTSIVLITSYAFISMIYPFISASIIETQNQFSDTDYVRIRGIIYFFNDFSKSIFGFCFGNGFSSTKFAYGEFVNALKVNDGIYTSDLGIYGTWVLYGFLSLLAIFKPAYTILRSSSYFMKYKLLILHTFIGFTMFYFFSKFTFVFYISVLYCFDYDCLMSKQKNK